VARTVAGATGGTPDAVATAAVAGAPTRRFTGADFAIDGGLKPTV
jgi:hypothetical protein